ncbi:hypothetical protein [Coralloluteibacterium thermophilus]|uniref:VCBS repeat-containing protein n=1 Tax=Coralloluteibacterium thermophilum TaxID=2707049 RepID=A0ABV9NI92_9GAMM
MLLLCAAAGAAVAQVQPLAHYRGLAGDERVELILVHDSAWDFVSGALFGPDRVLVPLEPTPHATDAPLVITTQAAGADLPEVALVLRPFAVFDAHLGGSRVDLRTRDALPLRLERVARFEAGTSAPAFDAELLQQGGGRDRYFVVHASKGARQQTGRVDRVDVYDRATGEVLQALDGLGLWFRGMETLDVFDMNGDGIVDFRATGLEDGNAQAVQYFLSQDGGYRRNGMLEKLAARGPLQFRDGNVQLRLTDTIDWDDRTCEWEHYRFPAPDRIEYTTVRREPCS